MGNLKTIHRVAANAQKINLDNLIAMCINESQYEWLAFNRGQLYMGTDVNLKAITPKYKVSGYAEGKNFDNPKPGLGTPDLYVTGSFYNGLGVVVSASKRTITTSSKDEKAPKLELKYGSKIYGLDPESRAQYSNEIIRPLLIKKFKTALFGI